jgi:hypothetical protein
VPQKSQRGQNIIGGLSYEPPLFSLQLGITINSDGRFMAINGTIPLTEALATPISPGDRMSGASLYNLGDVETAALVLGHELGHRRNIFGKDEEDGGDEKKSDRNTQKVYDACFKD